MHVTFLHTFNCTFSCRASRVKGRCFVLLVLGRFRADWGCACQLVWCAGHVVLARTMHSCRWNLMFDHLFVQPTLFSEDLSWHGLAALQLMNLYHWQVEPMFALHGHAI